MRKTKFLSVLFVTALLLAGCGFGKMIPRYPEVIVKLENPDLENKGESGLQLPGQFLLSI